MKYFILTGSVNIGDYYKYYLLMSLQFKRNNILIISGELYIRDHTFVASRALTKEVKGTSP